MSDQTPDVWTECGDCGLCYAGRWTDCPGCTAQAAALAVSEQCVELAALRHSIASLTAERDQLLAQRAESRRWKNLLELTTLRAERDALKAGAVTVTFGDADATIAALVAERDTARDQLHYMQETYVPVESCRQAERERDAAQQENQTLREALKALYEAFDCEAVAEGCDAQCQTCRAITAARAALSSSPRPQEPQPRVPGCDDRLAPLQPTDAVVAIARPQEISCGFPWTLVRVTSQEPGGHQP